MIEKFYSDQEKYAFSFQMMAYITRLSMLKKCIRENPNAIIICERSLNTDKNIFAKMLYDDNKIEDVKYQIYSNWFDEFISDIPECGIIYVRTEPTKCYERVKIRDRKGETIPLEYLEKCHDYHEKWINYDKNLKTILNGNEHKRDVKDYEMWIDTIYSLIRENNGDGETITQSKCLFTNKSHDIKNLLRRSESNEIVKNYLIDMWSNRADKYSEDRVSGNNYKVIKKAEMSYIGG